MNKRYIQIYVTLGLMTMLNTLSSVNHDAITIPKVSNADRILVDTIVARVNNANILLSDLLRPQISRDGAPLLALADYHNKNNQAFLNAVDTRIDEELQFQKASEKKLLPTELEIEKQIARFKQLHGLAKVDDTELERIIKSEGLSLARYRYQLKRWLAIEKLQQDELSKRLIVTSKEAEKYYHNHKEKQKARYKLAVATFNRVEIKQKNPTQRDLLNHKKIDWVMLPFLEKHAVRKDLSFVLEMSEGEISPPISVPQGYQLVKLLEKNEERYKTFQEQYVAIEKILVEQKREQFAHEYVKELRKKGHIIYLK